MQYKLGKLPARKDSIKLKVVDYIAQLKEAPAKFSNQSRVTGQLGMLGNGPDPTAPGVAGTEGAGDCVWAGGDHEEDFWLAEGGASNTTALFNGKTAISDYSAVTGYNPTTGANDNGTDMQVAAAYRQKTGLLDLNGNRHKIGAYLEVSVGAKELVKQAIYYFGSCGIGINFPQSAMDQFNEGKAWTVVSKSPIEGGHYVPAIGYDSDYLYVITWAKVQKMSWGFFDKYNDESIVYLSTEMLNGSGASPEGFNLTQLQADLKGL